MPECPHCGEPIGGAHTVTGAGGVHGCPNCDPRDRARADGAGLRAAPEETVEVRIRMPYGYVAGMTSALGAFLEAQDEQDLPELWDVVDGLNEVCPTEAVIGQMDSRPVYHPDAVDVELVELEDDPAAEDGGDGDDPDGTKIPLADGGRTVAISGAKFDYLNDSASIEARTRAAKRGAGHLPTSELDDYADLGAAGNGGDGE